jgi:hypothetical protein
MAYVIHVLKEHTRMMSLVNVHVTQDIQLKRIADVRNQKTQLTVQMASTHSYQQPVPHIARVVVQTVKFVLMRPYVKHVDHLMQ